MKKLPYGITDYKELREKDYYYVDKTNYLEELEKFYNKRLIYLRPRRFGKTLFTSMMYYYYDIKSKDMFEELFKDTYIHDKPTDLRNSYYVLKFDFSGVSTSVNDATDIKEQFNEKVMYAIKKFISYYNLNIEINYSKDANIMLLQLLTMFGTLSLDKKIYIIIDEYDKFTNAILEDNMDVFKSVLGKDGFVRAFYEIIKENCGTIVDRVFITGVCSISLDAMTSGFNIATNITNDKEFNAMTALTHDEVKAIMKDIDEKERENVFNIMLDNYDGYKFNNEVEEKVFNPTLVMYFLSSYYRFNKVPDELFDKNIISSFEQIKNIITIKDNKYYEDILKNIFNDKSVSGLLITNFDLELEVTRDIIVSLLYYFGYITISKKELGDLVYVIPNKVIEKVFYDYYVYLLKQDKIEFSDNIVDDAIYEMATNGKIKIITKMVEKVLAKSSNRVLENFSEKNIQVIYSALLSIRNVFNVYNEYEVESGYIDLMIFRKDKDTKYDIMIELKYIKKKEYSFKVLESTKIKAIDQINKYLLEDRIDKTNLKKYVVIFVGKKLEVLEEVI